ncbi:CHAT domain-containing protein [Hymenobacter terricola]|uniref:CHAT domain-containing protein n=1 Tax=Hymenobacter terricola TaxID=2819236 RepID=UPI001CF1A024|nr:CHAT domain-containing protein [Hymenobacter terricola]
MALHEQDNVVAVPVLVDMANRALSQLHVLRGTPGQITPVPERTIGFPVLPLGRDFERAVSSFYNFKKLRQLDVPAVTALCPFNLNQLPLQALMLKELQVTFPIYTSLQNKGAYPSPRHVLFWQGSSNTSEMEGDALAYIFEKAGVKLTVLVEGTATKQDFIDAYHSPDYDIIWVSSHGERGYYEPDNSSFALSHTEAVSLAELAAITVQQPHVRLLFLNVCEGGANTQIGEFLNVGFGHMLTSHNQDVLSHLWMADSLVAMLLGALVAEGLCQPGSTYFSAYQTALLTLISGEASIIDKLAALEPETPHPAITALIDRLQYSSNADLSNILKWGSAVYFT